MNDTELYLLGMTTLHKKGGYAVSAMGKDTVGALCLDDYKGPNRQYVDQDKLILQYYFGDTDEPQ